MRTGTYIAFDGLGKVNPTESDYRYYSTIKAWTENKNIDFKLVNSHEKTFAVRDTSKKATLQSRIRERLSKSKNMIVILSDKTRKSGSMLSYEIEQAVDCYEIPLIIAYTGYKVVADPQSLSSYWPYALSNRINNGDARAIHISFKKNPILDAIDQFNIINQPNSSLSYYTQEAHQNFGLITLLGGVAPFVNEKETKITYAEALRRLIEKK